MVAVDLFFRCVADFLFREAASREAALAAKKAWADRDVKDLVRVFYRRQVVRVKNDAAQEDSDLDHFEVFLAGSAFRAGPIHGHIFPAGLGRYSVLGGTCGFVIYPAANQAHPGFRVCHSLRGLHIECNDCI